jgi:cysteinyl-tRNA synthetase
MDLQFPHHENEIAQTVGGTGEQFVNYWMHNGFVRVDNEKMSKSLGNFFTLKEVRESYQPEVIRYFILSSHYRSPLNYSNESLDDAKAALVRLYTALRNINMTSTEVLGEYKSVFEQAMNDDFNTPEALAVLFSLTTALNKLKQAGSTEVEVYANTLKTLAAGLGILQDMPDSFLQDSDGDSSEDLWIVTKINQRSAAKKNKDWQLADQIRDELKADGIIVEDNAGGTTWRRL